MKTNPFRIERFFDKYEFSVPYLLSASDCEAWRVEEILALDDDAEQRLRSLSLGYTMTSGSPALRSAIAGLYQSVAADDIVVHAGGEEVIFVFSHAVLSPGDHVVIHTPCYESLIEMPRRVGCDITRWEAVEADGWSLDLDFLEANIRPTTRAVFVNLPHNPTGWLMSHEEWNRLIDIVRRHDIILFSDEAYRGIEPSSGTRLPAACDLYDKACSLGLVSKGLGLPGLRIGWLATRSDEIRRSISVFKDWTTICSSAPSELMAEIALRHSEQLFERARRIIRDNLLLLNEFFERRSDIFGWVPPKAGPVAFPHLLTKMDAKSFCRQVVESAEVMLLPGSVFDKERHLRFGFGRSNLPQALDRLDSHLGRA